MKLSPLPSPPLAAHIAVVIPSYKVAKHIKKVIAEIPEIVWRIYVVDDACPDHSGKLVEESIVNERLRVIYHEKNKGVGGAVMTGYQAAIDDGAKIIVKVDGDGQMDPALIQYFVEPILSGEADYTKGNRFYDLEKIRSMPAMRLFGNSILSLMAKISSGYWNLFDPTNGYTAIHSDVAKLLPFTKISQRYFFETDLLFRLNTFRAVVVDVPMDAKYEDEVSNLKISRIMTEFLFKHTRNSFKRIFYNYYLRDLSLASFELPIGLSMLFFGLIYGAYHWVEYAQLNIPAPSGIVMLSALPLMIGLQLVLAFLGYDVSSVPSRPIHKRFTPLVALE